MSDDNFAIPAPKRKEPDYPPLPYAKPEWSADPLYDYGFEVLKNGLSLEKINGPRKEFVTIGRLPVCDIQMEHPSVSRYHAIIQFNHDGNAFIYDMDSAHGTRVNKQQIHGRQYVPLKPGDQVRFGESTRLCIFETDDQVDEEEEIEKEQAIRNRSRASMTEHAAEEEEGISWGFAEDAEEEPEEEEEGQEPSGDAALIDVVKEKMMVEDAKRRREELDIMYGDESDEEALYDKTAPKKKVKRSNKAETYEDLVERKKQTEKEIKALEAAIAQRKKEVDEEKGQEKADDQDLDAYMNSLSNKPSEKKTSVYKLTSDLKKLQKELGKLEKLVELTKPSDIFG